MWPGSDVSGPGSREILESRIAVERDELDRVERYLDLDLLAGVVEEDLANTLRMQLADCRASLDRARGYRDEQAWIAIEGAIIIARRLGAEIFTLLQGQLFRSANLDDGVLRAAVHLLEGVRRRCSVYRGVLTTFSPDVESMDHTIGLVRLRFPGTTVWDLPFCVHEFGHHAVRELPHVQSDQHGIRPLQAIVDGPFGVGAGFSGSHSHELVADVFATFALGPTYPLACIVQRVDPKKAANDSDSHPSWTRRLSAMLAALRHLTRISGDSRYRDTAEEIVLPVWRGMTGAEQAASPDAGRLKALAHVVVKELNRHASRLRYDDRDRAVLVQRLLSEPAAPFSADRLPPGVGPAVVVDAAWRWRRYHPDRFTTDRGRVNDMALSYCSVASLE